MTADDVTFKRQLKSDYFRTVRKVIASSADFSSFTGYQAMPMSQMIQPIVDKWWDTKKIQTVAEKKSFRKLKTYLNSQSKESLKGHLLMKEPSQVLKRFNLKLDFKPSSVKTSQRVSALSKQTEQACDNRPLPLFRRMLDPAEQARKGEIL